MQSSKGRICEFSELQQRMNKESQTINKESRTKIDKESKKRKNLKPVAGWTSALSAEGRDSPAQGFPKHSHCTLLHWHCKLQIAHWHCTLHITHWHCTFHIAHCQFIERLLLKHCYWYILLLALLLVHIVIETFIAWQRLPPSIETLFPQLESLQMQLVPRLANLSNLSSGLAGLPWCLNWPICLPDGRQLPW